MAILSREKQFYRQVLTISAPIAAQQVITVGVNMMDTIMLGQLDEVSLSASSMGAQVHLLFGFMCMGLAMGANVLIARFWGAKEHKSLRKSLALMYRFCLILSLIYTLAAALFPAGIIRLFTPDPAVIAEGVRYLRWTLPCFFLYGLSQTTTIVLRNIGMTHIPLYTSIGAFFINIFFNWIFIFGKLGAPAMGTAGAALGTTISRIFECAVIFGFFFFRDKIIRFRFSDLLIPCRDLLKEYLRFALPVLVSDTLLGLGNSMVLSIAGHIGTVFMSANTITNSVQQISSVVGAALGQSAAILIGNTLGRGAREKAMEQGATFTILGALFGLCCSGIILLISPFVVNAYQISAETRAVATELMYAAAIIALLMTVSSILTKGVLRGGGDTRFLMVGDILFLWVVSVPLGAAAGLLWHWPPFWILLCLRVDHVLKIILCLFRLRSGKWIKKISPVN